MTISIKDRQWLQMHPLFSSLAENEFNELMDYVKLISFSANELIIDINQHNCDLYIIQHGTAKTYDPAENNTILSVATFQEGDIIGEAAFLTQEMRICNVIASKPCDVFIISENLIHEKKLLFQNCKNNYSLL